MTESSKLPRAEDPRRWWWLGSLFLVALLWSTDLIPWFIGLPLYVAITVGNVVWHAMTGTLRETLTNVAWAIFAGAIVVLSSYS